MERYYYVAEKIKSKNDFIDKSVRYFCDMCGATHTTLDVYEENDIVLCPRCEHDASYDVESHRPEIPNYLAPWKSLGSLSVGVK